MLDGADVTVDDRAPGPPALAGAPDAVALRSLLGTFATGVAVLTVGGTVPRGMTANSFVSVSLDPPLVLACVDRSATMHAIMCGVDVFGVSILASDQEPVARYFADCRRPSGAAQFTAVDWVAGDHTGAPLLLGALAWFECRLWRAYDGGDHTIFVARVLSAVRVPRTGPGRRPLVFHQGGFSQLG